MDKRISDDSREKLEADIADYFSCWFGGGENTRAAIIGWLDRQAAITASANAELIEKQAKTIVMLQELVDECDKPNWEYCETCERLAELQAKLDAYDETHMELPVDADGVPIRVGDEIQFRNDSPITVDSIGTSRVYESDWGFFGSNGGFYGQGTMKNVCHVKPRTIEDVLRDFAQEMNENLGLYTGEAIDADEWRDADSETVKKYAAELRELMGSDGE